MRLEVGPNIDNRTVRLDFRKGEAPAEYMPSYKIKKTKADEFVTKYNKQSSRLKKITNLLVAGLAIIGGIFGAYFKNKKVWLPFGVIAGAAAGLGAGAMVSTNKRNKLMDKYDVRPL